MAEIKCGHCGRFFKKENKEYNRKIRLGNVKFYCSLRCSGLAQPTKRVTKPCALCGKVMELTKKRKKNSFCSRECASAGSMTAERLEAIRRLSGSHEENLQRPAYTLKSRELWKYVELEKYLNAHGISHEFECEVSGYVCDLYLAASRTVIEFDGPYHVSPQQRARDVKRDGVITALGIKMLRIKVPPATVIDVELVKPYLIENNKEDL